MGYLVIAGILLFITLIAAGLVGASVGKLAATGVGVVGVVLIVAVTLIASFTQVEARSVAVQTSFGKYVTTLDAGSHFIAPWASIEEFTTTVQTVDLDDSVPGGGGKVAVNFNGGGSGGVNTTLGWYVSEAGVQDLWKKYRTYDSAETNLVAKKFRDAVINSTNDFTTFDALSKQGDLRNDILKQVQGDLAPYGITVDSVSISSIPLEAKTQASYDAINVANNRVVQAEAEKKRADIDAQTAKVRAESGSSSPEALTRYCLDVANNWDSSKNGPLPATFDCSLFNGTSAPVIVQAPAAAK